ncbi:MAG: hypothetical protein PHR66_13465, partial [Desulfuromonadaceae bacterium]|nr:hypothetical protein [Desulfuromonadaceae bacterium]
LSITLMNKLKSIAHIIITHSKKGLEDLKKEKHKSFYFIHPTKNRGILPKTKQTNDLLIWGNISRYKGVLEFLIFNKNSKDLKDKKIKIIGKCSDVNLLKEIKEELVDNVSFENRSIDFEELKDCVAKTKFVLMPYASESILSSGILMDSLSVGACVIGPNVGAFKDLLSEKSINVKTFNNFNDLKKTMEIKYNFQESNYKLFLKRHSWQIFVDNLNQIILDS